MKYFLISDNVDTLAGMRLVGVRGVVVHEEDEVRAALDKACADPDIGLVLITDKLVAYLNTSSRASGRSSSKCRTATATRTPATASNAISPRSWALKFEVTSMNKKAAEQQRAVRSMETPEQYSEFEDSVIEAAKTQAQRIIDDARRQGDANFDKLMEGHRGDPLIPYREEAKNRLARKMASVKQDNRKKLLVYRSQLVNGLFAEMEEALEEYTGTPAYAQRVADALARRAPEISGKCTVRLRRADEALLASVVKKALPSADIAVDGSIRLGGVKLETQHILYDETLDFAAAAERAAFLTRCKLRVE